MFCKTNGYVVYFQLAVSCFESLLGAQVKCCGWLVTERRQCVLCQQEGVVRAKSEPRGHSGHYGQFPRLWTVCITEASGARPRDPGSGGDSECHDVR